MGQFNETNNQRSLPLSEPSIGITSTSDANGVSGALNLALDLYSFTGNATYKTWADQFMNWLNGSIVGQERYQYSTVINGSLSTNIALGRSHGIAGNLAAFDHYVSITGSNQYDEVMETFLFYLHNTGNETTETYKYPTSIVSGSISGLGSMSYGQGGGGILPLIASVAEYLNITQLDDEIRKAKSYLYSFAINASGFDVIPSINTGVPENNPSNGFVSSYHALFVSVTGQLEVLSTGIDYGLVEVGDSVSSSITLQNVGDETLSVFWTQISQSSSFLVSNNSKIMEPRSQYQLFISFIPTEETTYEESFSITSNRADKFQIDLIGEAFTLPTLNLTEIPENGSTFTSRDNVEFNVESEDISDVTEVTFSINGSSRQMTSSPGSSTYTTIWDLSNIENGTYFINITASDSIGYSNVKQLVYEVAIYDPPLAERIFSPTTLYIVGGITVVVLLAAIIVTRKYMN